MRQALIKKREPRTDGVQVLQRCPFRGLVLVHASFDKAVRDAIEDYRQKTLAENVVRIVEEAEKAPDVDVDIRVPKEES